MFTYDVTCEDTRIIVSSNDGVENYTGKVHDNFTGMWREVSLTPLQLSMLLAILLDKDGTPAGYETMYKELEPLFKDWPVQVRPIP